MYRLTALVSGGPCRFARRYFFCASQTDVRSWFV